MISSNETIRNTYYVIGTNLGSRVTEMKYHISLVLQYMLSPKYEYILS